MVGHILLSACKVVFFPLFRHFETFFAFPPKTVPTKNRPLPKPPFSYEIPTLFSGFPISQPLQADSKICPTMAPYLTFRDGHFDTSNMKIG